MDFIFANTYVFLILLGASVFVIAYLNMDKALSFLYKKSLGSYDDFVDIMEKMLITGNVKTIKRNLIILSSIMGFLFFILLASVNIILALLVGLAMSLLVWIGAKSYLESLWKIRCKKVVVDMVDAMTLMSNGVRSGLSLAQSLERVTQNKEGPLSQEFKLILNKLRLGMSLEEALVEFSERVPEKDIQIFVMSVNILKETGGNLAETFDTIMETIRERQKLEKKIDAMTTMARTQGLFMALIPLVLLVVLAIVNTSYILPLFQRPLGWAVLVAIFVLEAMGAVAIKKIATIKV